MEPPSDWVKSSYFTHKILLSPEAFNMARFIISLPAL